RQAQQAFKQCVCSCVRPPGTTEQPKPEGPGEFVTFAPTEQAKGRDDDTQRMAGEVDPNRTQDVMDNRLLPSPPRDRFAFLRNVLTLLSRPGPSMRASRSPLATFTPQAPAARPLLVLLTSLGGYTGDVMQMRVINGTGRPLSLAGETFAMEPLKKDAADDARKAFEREEKVAGKPAPLLRVNAYCLEFLKHPPEAGMVFRLADAGAQERF